MKTLFTVIFPVLIVLMLIGILICCILYHYTIAAYLSVSMAVIVIGYVGYGLYNRD
jgi:hypothetical protein